MFDELSPLRHVRRQAIKTACVGTLLVIAPLVHATPADVVSSAARTSATFAPALGYEAVYDIQSEGQFQLDHLQLAALFGKLRNDVAAPGAQTSQEFRARAQLHLRVIERTAEGYLFAAHLRNVDMLIDGQTDPRVREAETPFALHMRTDGSIAKIELPNRFPEDIATVVRGLVEPMQVTLSGEGDDMQWTATERATAGDSFVSYRKKATAEPGNLHFERKVLNARRMQNLAETRNGDQPSRMQTRVTQSAGEVIWDTQIGMLRTIRSQDSTVTALNGKNFADQEQRFQGTLMVGQQADVVSTRAALQSLLRDDRAGRRSLYAVDAHIAPKLLGMTTEKVMTLFRNQVDAGQTGGAAYLLEQYLRRMPNESQKIVAILLDQDFSTEAGAHLAMVGFGGVGAAGHPEAQQAIAEIIASDQYDYPQRRTATVGSLSVDWPETFLLDAIWGFRESLPREPTARNLERLSEITNMYGVAAAVEKGITVNTDRAMRVMGERLKGTQDRFEKLFMLVAMGNIGDLARGLPLAAPYFSSADEDLSSRAFSIFQRCAGEDAVLEWKTRFQDVRNVNVRQIAAQVLLDMPRTEARAKVAREMVLSEKDKRIQSYLIRIIGQEIQAGIEENNMDALRELLSSVRDRKLRKEIYRYVKPQRGGSK